MTTENEAQPVEEIQEPISQQQVGLFNVEEYEVPPPFTLPSEERMQDIALNAIGKIPLQDLINDAVSALLEVYRAKPEICQLDIGNYNNYPPLIANPFMDLVDYLKELNHGREH
tara:strand:+ start:26 stop:367 length:342 start_codon:yes stop_codon:yes gene_type:complete